MNFLKNYVHFEDTENSSIFDQELRQITGRTETMGIEELILTTERKRAEKRGIERGTEQKEREIILNMIRKSTDDKFIADFAGVPVEYVQKVRDSFKK